MILKITNSLTLHCVKRINLTKKETRDISIMIICHLVLIKMKLEN